MATRNIQGTVNEAYQPLIKIDGQNYTFGQVVSLIYEDMDKLASQPNPGLVGVSTVLVTNSVLPDLSNLSPAGLILLEYTQMSEDVDLSLLSQSGVPDGAIVRIRKMDTSPYRLIFNDGYTYKYVSKQGEFMSLKNDLSTQFHLI